MQVLVVVAHPKKNSFTHALTQEFVRGLALAGHSHRLLDLYQDRFDPLVTAQELENWQSTPRPPEIQTLQEAVRSAQGLAFIYPVWWGTPPAMLQGWLQRVFTEGFAFEYTKGGHGKLRHRAQLIINIGSHDERLHTYYVQPLVGVLEYCGIRDIRRLVNWGIHPATPGTAIEGALQAAFTAGREF